MSESNSYAVVKTGGKQFKVSPGQKLRVSELDGAVGDSIVLNEVLMVGETGKAPTIGKPIVSGASVKAKILVHDKAAKVLIYKKKRRTGYTKKQGHRQAYTELLIESINS